jgi:serine/threonine protein kinase
LSHTFHLFSKILMSRPQSSSLKRHVIGEAPLTGASLRSRYTKSEKLGSGAYGVVYKAQCNSSQKLVALKRVRLDLSHDGVPATTIREIACLRGLGRHPNVLSLLDVESSQSAGRPCLHIITDLLDMDLATWLHNEAKAPSGKLLRHLMHQMLAGLDFCHTNQVSPPFKRSCLRRCCAA